jgi:isoleucyl-tRNA synthetase
VKAGDWSEAGGVVTAGGVELGEGEYTLRLVPADEERSAALPGNAGVVVLDTEVTPGLEAEGQARDLVRAVQQARRDAGLHVSDRIRLVVRTTPELVAGLTPYREFVAGEVLATESALVADDTVAAGEYTVELEKV